MAIVGRQAATTRAHFPAPLASLDASELGLDLYIRSSPTAPPALYRSAGLAFDDEDRTRLIEQGIEFLYISVEHHAEYQKMLSNRVASVMHDTSLSDRERRDIITGICGKLIDDAMETSSAESVASLFEIGNTIGQIAAAEGDAAFGCLLNMSGHDFYTATHMMNVAIGCGLLASAARPGNTEFVCAMIRAGLVHDLGKAEIPAEVLNKEGKLTDEEFELIKSHPMAGVRALRELGVKDEITIECARDHHEHMAGSGYPRGIDATKLGMHARIMAIVDVYDALTSARPYRGPISWQGALDMMDESRGSQFDPELLDMWKKIIIASAADHAHELPSPTADARSIDDLMPHDQRMEENISEVKAKLGITTRYKGHEKRVNERITCSIRAAVVPILEDGESTRAIDTRILDISKCGIRFASHEKFNAGDRIRIRASLGGGKRLDAEATIVRPSMEANRDGLWEFGCIFKKAVRANAA